MKSNYKIVRLEDMFFFTRHILISTGIHSWLFRLHNMNLHLSIIIDFNKSDFFIFIIKCLN